MFARTARRSFIARSGYTSRQALAPRQLSTSSRQLARKDSQDKDSLNPQPNEISKSGSDDQAAAVADTAFDPKQTSPEEQHDNAGAEAGKKEGDMNNPLNVSPANQEVSKPRGGQEGGHEGSSSQSGQGNSDRARTSGGGGGAKNGGGKSG